MHQHALLAVESMLICALMLCTSTHFLHMTACCVFVQIHACSICVHLMISAISVRSVMAHRVCIVSAGVDADAPQYCERQEEHRADLWQGHVFVQPSVITVNPKAWTFNI